MVYAKLQSFLNLAPKSPNFPPTEPKFFRNLRLLCLITFSILFCLYGLTLLVGFVSHIHKPTLYVSELLSNHYLYGDEFDIYTFLASSTREKFLDNVRGEFTYPELTICPKTRSDLSPLNNNFTIRDDSNFTIIQYRDYAKNYKDKSECSTLELRQYYNASEQVYRILNVTDQSRVLINITFNNLNYDYLEIQFNSVYINSTTPTKLALSKYFITRGQHVIYDFIIRERKFYSLYSFGMFSTKADQKIAIIEIEKKELPPIPNASYTILELKPKNSFIKYEEEKFQSTVISVISNLGGFFSALTAIFALLFGARKHSPWGVFQTSCLCVPFRRRFKRDLANMYVSHAGIPLVDDPRHLPGDATIEDRVAILEHLLREYYLDASCLETLSVTRRRYRRLKSEVTDELVNLIPNHVRKYVEY